MLAQLTKGKQANENTLAFLLKNYWLYILIGLVCIPFIIKIWYSQLSGVERQQEEIEKDRWFREAQDPQILNQKWNDYLNTMSPANFATSPQQVKDAARRIIEGFNINIWDSDSPWTKINPEGWFEQPELYLPPLLDEQLQYDFAHIAELYYIGTRKRMLEEDIVRILPRSKQIELKEGGLTWLNV